MIINQGNLQGIYKSFQTIFNEAWDTAAPSQWPIVSMEVPSETREENYDWLGDLPMMKEWVGDRVIKDLSAFHYAIVITTTIYARRTLIIRTGTTFIIRTTFRIRYSKHLL